MHTHTYIYTYIYTYTHTLHLIQVMQAYKSIHTHTHAYMHTHIHTGAERQFEFNARSVIAAIDVAAINAQSDGKLGFSAMKVRRHIKYVSVCAKWGSPR